MEVESLKFPCYHEVRLEQNIFLLNYSKYANISEDSRRIDAKVLMEESMQRRIKEIPLKIEYVAQFAAIYQILGRQTT